MRDNMKKRYVFFQQLQESLRQRDISFLLLGTKVEHLTERLIYLEDIHAKTQATLVASRPPSANNSTQPLRKRKLSSPTKCAIADTEIPSFSNNEQAARV